MRPGLGTGRGRQEGRTQREPDFSGKEEEVKRQSESFEVRRAEKVGMTKEVLEGACLGGDTGAGAQPGWPQEPWPLHGHSACTAGGQERGG